MARAEARLAPWTRAKAEERSRPSRERRKMGRQGVVGG